MRFPTFAGALALVAAPLSAQQPAPPTSATIQALIDWIALDAPPGEEDRATTVVLRADARWHRDDVGNLTLRAGAGRPRRLVACGLDHVGHVVSQITDDGFVRLHRAGSGTAHPLWDQFQEAQQIEILTARGKVPGVVAVANGHFARQHRADTTVVNVDQLWVDVGARTRTEAENLGIALLDPVRRALPPWPFSDYVAGADAAGRAGCAAVAAAARATPTRGETVFVLSAQRSFNWAGLGAAAARLGPLDEIVVVTRAEGIQTSEPQRVRRRRVARPRTMPASLGVDSVTLVELRPRFEGTLVEAVRAADADSLLAAVRVAAGVDASSSDWLRLRNSEPTVARRDDAFAATAALLTTLVELPGVPAHEWQVRDAVRAALPAWARERAVVDSVGNLVVAVGPDRDTTVIVAHMDEVSYAVASIAADGSVALTARGGVIPSAWEGQPALLHFDPEPAGSRPSLPGVFVPRDSASRRRPDEVRAWFGLDSAGLVARGVRVGQGVTGFKRGRRLGITRFTARSLDDRAGSTALLLAVRTVDPDRLTHKVVFAWSMGEEGGLVGAQALARRMGRTVHRVYAIDTFVSSDTPLESPHFAFVPLGNGAVLRGLDDGLVAQRAERARVIAIARAGNIPLQVGTTHGSTDATAFVAFGAPGMGLSWPGRYSHSPAEVLDLRDLEALARLIRAVAVAPAR